MNRKTITALNRLMFLAIIALHSALILIPEMVANHHPEVEPFTAEDLIRPLPTPTSTPTPSPVPDNVRLQKWSEFQNIQYSFDFDYEVIVTDYLCEGYITAYCDCSKCCWPSTGYTASGVKTHYSEDWKEATTCAIDPRYFKFGTEFMIDGKIYVAEDSGSAVKGRHWDLYQPSHDRVTSFNTHYGSVYLVHRYTHTVTAEERKMIHGLINSDLCYGSSGARILTWNNDGASYRGPAGQAPH